MAILFIFVVDHRRTRSGRTIAVATITVTTRRVGPVVEHEFAQRLAGLGVHARVSPREGGRVVGPDGVDALRLVQKRRARGHGVAGGQLVAVGHVDLPLDVVARVAEGPRRIGGRVD